MDVCDQTWPILQTHLSGVITVTEEEVVSAMRTVRLYNKYSTKGHRE